MEITENTTVKGTFNFADFLKMLAFYFKYSPSKEPTITELYKIKKEGEWGIKMSRKQHEEVITFYFKAQGIQVTNIVLHKDTWSIEGKKGEGIPLLQSNVGTIINKYAQHLSAKTIATMAAFAKMHNIFNVEDFINHQDFKEGNLGLPGIGTNTWKEIVLFFGKIGVERKLLPTW